MIKGRSPDIIIARDFILIFRGVRPEIYGEKIEMNSVEITTERTEHMMKHGMGCCEKVKCIVVESNLVYTGLGIGAEISNFVLKAENWNWRESPAEGKPQNKTIT